MLTEVRREHVSEYTFDRDYLERLASGDASAQQHFVRYFGDLLRIKLRARLRSSHLVEDARQETFLRTLVALRQGAVHQPERLGAFVNSVCNNVLLEMFRAEGRWASIEDDAQFEAAEATESTVVAREQHQAVQEVLRSMPARDREVLRQVFLEERDKDEVCRSLDVSREHLRVLVHRAGARFRELLAGQEERSGSIRTSRPRVSSGGKR
jgi:RNA polymerase sigma-70 factor (ECF subfamily)